MGEEDLTKEERETLGKESEEEGTGTQETSEEEEGEKETPETEQIEKEKGEKDNLIPQARLDQMRKEKGDIERKLDLLQRDPEEYYRKYPDEKIEKESEDVLARPTAVEDEIWNMVIKGGPYDGQTLGDVHDQGGQAARYALSLYNNQRDTIRTEIQRSEDRKTQLLVESENEINQFVGVLSNDIFSKKPNDLSEDEGQQIRGIIDDTLKWMEETGRGSGFISDAYFLKNKDKILSGEQIKGISSLIKSSQTISSVANKKDTDLKRTGYETDLNISADELANKIENMTDDEASKYLRNAPQKLKDKFPGLPW